MAGEPSADVLGLPVLGELPSGTAWAAWAVPSSREGVPWALSLVVAWDGPGGGLSASFLFVPGEGWSRDPPAGEARAAGVALLPDVLGPVPSEDGLVLASLFSDGESWLLLRDVMCS